MIDDNSPMLSGGISGDEPASVFVVFEYEFYDGSNIIGAFSTLEKAQELGMRDIPKQSELPCARYDTVLFDKDDIPIGRIEKIRIDQG